MKENLKALAVVIFLLVLLAVICAIEIVPTIAFLKYLSS